MVLPTRTIHCSKSTFYALKCKKLALFWGEIWNLHQPIWLVIVVVNCCFGVIPSFAGVSFVLDFFAAASDALDFYFVGVPECSSCLLFLVVLAVGEMVQLVLLVVLKYKA